MSQLGLNNDYEFIIDSERLGTETIDEPLNWNEVEKEYARANIGFGTLEKINTTLELIGTGYEYIQKLLFFGFGDEIYIKKRAKSKTKIGEDWEVEYDGYLNIKTVKNNKTRLNPSCAIEFTQGGLFDKIKARYNDKYDLVDLLDADGNEIDELETVIEQVQGREIFRESIGTVADGLIVQHSVTTDIFGNGDTNVARSVPIRFKPNSDEGYLQSIPENTSIPYAGGTYATADGSALMMKKDSRTRTRRLNGTITIDIVDGDTGYIHLEKVYYNYNSTTLDYNFDRREELVRLNNPSIGQVLTYTFNDEEIELNDGEGFALVLHSDTDDGMGYSYRDSSLTTREDDNYNPSTAKVLLPKQMIDRLLQKITGENGLFISNYFDTGEFALLGVSSGFWARGYDDGEPIPDPKNEGEFYPKKQFTISLKEAFESFQVPDPLMWAITKIRGKEYLKMEHYDFTQQDFPGITLGREVNGVIQKIPAEGLEEEVVSEYLFTAANIGYNEGGSGFEDVAGLSTPFGIGSFNTSLKSGEPNIYTKTSKIRADLEGFDLARRKPSINFYDTDTPYDQKLFFRHLKKVGNQYFLRTWQDDFESEPRNIYSPNTTGNLLLSPFRCALRHGRILRTSVIGMDNDKFVAISSEANNNKLITKRANEIEIDESGFVLNSQLGFPYNTGFLMTFSGKVFQSMIKQIEGFTIINGEKVPNWYGLYEVEHRGTIYYGKMTNIKINGEGSHEMMRVL